MPGTGRYGTVASNLRKKNVLLSKTFPTDPQQDGSFTHEKLIAIANEKLLPFEKFRGALLFDANSCISCNLCVKACPSNCIQLENATNETGKKIAKVAWYSIDFGKCNFCRLCEEACPTKPRSVWHSLDYEVIFTTRDEMVRCWKQSFPFFGKYFDSRSKDFKDPEGQVSIHEVQPRRN
jgi:formate hydrogenlyase subunit 6/NADH:ubiquinone oxidoreductase subunit I